MPRRSNLTLALVGLAAALVSVVVGIAAKNTPALGQYWWVAWLVLVAIVGLSAWWFVQVQRDEETKDLPDAQLKRHRLQMIRRVRHDWIEGVLNQSLYQVARIELGLETAPEAVEPLNLLVQRTERGLLSAE